MVRRRPMRKVIPTGFLPFANLRANPSFTMATFGEPLRSCSSKSRPASIAVCSVWKNPGLTRLNEATGASPFGAPEVPINTS